MAVTALVPGSLTESVKEAVKSTTTCSASTVSSLQLLLGSVTKHHSDNSRASSRAANRSKATTVTTTATRTKSTRSVNPRIAAKVAVFQATTEVEDGGPHLSQQEKLVLATEVFNATSKALSDALQQNTLPKAPLQPTSPNRIITTPAKSKASKDTLATTANWEGGVIAVAECARLALSCLRSIKTEKLGENTYPNLQLEQGTCVLVGRLMALSLQDLAHKELRALKKRLQQYMEKTSNDKPNKIDSTYEGRQENEAEKETMAELLSFSHLENSKPLLGIIILFQTNALKLILAERKSSVLEKICNSLALSSPSSPANIIVNAVQAGSLTKDKAALQLLSLSNTVSSLSLLAQRSTSASSTTNPQKRPANTLVLQLLSLEIRTVSWTLSDHKSDSKREFWDPLVRSLETFAVSNDGRLEKTDFATIYKSVQRLQSRMAKDQEKVSTDGMATVSWKIAFALGRVAQDASCFEEALKLFSNAVNSPIGEQPLSFSSIRCRISFIHLHRQRSTKDYPTFMVSQSLLDAANGLKSSNRGSNSDLEELLMESAKLKKLAMACLGESLSSTETKNELEEPTTGYLHAYIRFLRRYVGRPSTDDSSSKDSEQLQLVLQRSKNIILTAVDSTVALAKMSVLRQAPSWINVQPILSDCKRLLTALENLTDKESANDDHWQISLVKLSNVYWSRYLKEKESGKDFAELIPLLEQATSILQNCPASDRAAGFAALKFERLSYLYSEARMGAKSATTLQRSIEEHIDSGTLHEFTRSLSGRPAHVLFHDVQSPGFTLSRVLSTYLKLQMRRRESAEQAILDNRSLNLEERGILLEWQMGLLMETHQGRESDKESFRSLLQNVISQLLSLYPAQHYPTRRSRVVLHVLRFSLEHPHAIDSAITDSLVKDFALNLSSNQDPILETDLENFSMHVRNSLHLVLLFRDGSLNTEDLQPILSSWASMIHKCPDWESVETFVDDPEYWISQLKAVADYMEARGLQHLHLAATALLIRIMELQGTKDISSIVLNLSRCALQYCRLGDCKGCLSLLDRAGYYTNNNDVSCYALVSYNLVLTEYFLEIGDQAKAENTLTDAQGIYDSRLPETELNGRSKLSWERIVVDGTLLCSRIAHLKGSLRSALYFAKLSVRLSTRLWTKLERLSGKKRESEQIAKEQPEIDMLIDGVANIDIAGAATSPTWNYTEGAVFWPHVASHHACLLNLMRLSAHNGLFQDAIYYGEQALKATKSFGASVRSITCQTELGLEWIRGDRISDAKELLDAATILSKNQDNSIEIVALKASLAVLSKAQGHHDDVISLLQDAETSLAQLSRGQLGISLLTNGPELGIEEKMANMKIRRTAVNKEADTATARRPRRTKAPSKTASKTEQESETRHNSIESRSILLLKTEIIRQRAHSLLATQELDQALRLLNMAKEYSLPVKNQISLQIDEIEHILADAIRSVATHAVYCVLSESTLSLPSVECLKLICDSNADATKSSASKRPAPASKKQRAPVKETRSRAARVIKEDVNITGIMSNAKIAIAETVRNAAAFGSTVEGHAAASLMGRVSMLLHAMAPGLVDQDVLTPANANELGRITAFERERLAIDIDKQLAGCSDSMKWPVSMNSSLATKSDIVTSFTRNYVDILPPSWNVLSVSLNIERTEFVISKMCRGRTPFLLRLPLKRGNDEDEDEDEEEFTFATGKLEMKEIIKLANASAHDAKSRVDRNSKKEWWATRESLDRRLEALLSNMENIWLGGFRGIFSATPRDSELLSRFAAAFETVLDKHLPSRRKAANKSEKIKLHENVLELFVGLRHIDKQENPEDSLMDLLYFVVDILQFQGERNAYDEIDFDMMVVDTLDALRAHDEAARNADCVRPNHTILILDKSLHSFPWESLPCLQGFPVSRIPSLECLRNRVLQFNAKQDDERHEFAIDRHNGSFILNPSGDLKTTQSTFEEELSSMEGWSSIVNRAPTEEEFKSALVDKSLFLYFGHGSGAQYIRGRTIKRLDQCAVTFLMGCSSGCLTEAGELEPYGTPINYMHAGSPALVATLWDVTDKDIDRFAKSTFEKWGLIQGDLPDEDTKGSDIKSKTLKRRASVAKCDDSNDRGLALDEAVTKSRDSCVLKYLNGAAPVIYGIPVYLSAEA